MDVWLHSLVLIVNRRIEDGPQLPVPESKDFVIVQRRPRIDKPTTSDLHLLWIDLQQEGGVHPINMHPLPTRKVANNKESFLMQCVHQLFGPKTHLIKFWKRPPPIVHCNFPFFLVGEPFFPRALTLGGKIEIQQSKIPKQKRFVGVLENGNNQRQILKAFLCDGSFYPAPTPVERDGVEVSHPCHQVPPGVPLGVSPGVLHQVGHGLRHVNDKKTRCWWVCDL